MRLPNNTGVLVLLTCACGFGAIWSHDIGLYCFIGSLVLLIGNIVWHNINGPRSRKRWLDRASISPVILAPPFEDRWKVVAGGPDPRHNHHISANDQYFAYDFVCEEGDSFGQSIVAPCAGMVAHVENRQPDAPPGERSRNRKRPFGNYVSIQVRRGYVILAHLKQGSVQVRVGDNISAGVEIGRCGNSGNSRGAHLHLHAQDQPSRNVEANAIPVAFTDRLRSEPLLLEYGDTLG